jgi:type VI secretion system secreted protein Hcp
MASDYLLEIDGIKGESKDKFHPGAIEVSSFSWGVSNAGSGGSGGGGGAGKASFQDLHFTTKVHKASPLLMLRCAAGKHIPSAILTCRKAGDKPFEYLKIKLEDVLISSYQTGGAGGDVPTDQVSLNFTKITYSYYPESATGAPGVPVTTSWDIKRNEGA